MLHFSTRPSFFNSAFTLIEVSVAVGIVAVATLPIVAMMPVGLTAMKDEQTAQLRPKS